MTMPVDIGALVPHAGAMCLLERVVIADERRIVCATHSHRAPANPLRLGGQLSALHLAEYGAQAMAVHGGLMARVRAPRSGVLASIRKLRLFVPRLDDIDEELLIHAQRELSEGAGAIYEFVAEAGGKTLGSGRIAVLWQPHSSSGSA